MKRSNLKRNTPLARNARLPRASAKRAAAVANGTRVTRRRDTGPSAHTVAQVAARDAQTCFRCGGALWGERGRDWSVQHRRARGAGGTRRPDTNEPQALILLCGSATTGCHGWVESHRTEALANGWVIRQSDDPLLVPVAHWLHGVVFLDAVGGWTHTRPSTSSPRLAAANANQEAHS